MADLGFKDVGAFDQFFRGQQEGTALAQARAQALLSDIEARRKNEMIDAQLMADRMRSEAYAKQVALQEQSMKQGKPYDVARADWANMQALHPEIVALLTRGKKDPIAGQAAWSQLLQRPAAARFKETVGETFDPEAIEAMAGSIVPKEAAGLSRAELQAAAAEERALLAANAQLERQRIANEGRVAAAGARPDQGPSVDKLYAQLLQKQAQGIPLSPQEEEALRRIESVYKPASAMASPAQTTPRVDVRRYGVPTTTPAEERQRIQGQQQPKEFNYVPGRGLVPVQ